MRAQFLLDMALIGDVLKHAMGRFRTAMPGAGSPADQLRTHFAGIRRLVRDEPELFAVMGESDGDLVGGKILGHESGEFRIIVDQKEVWAGDAPSSCLTVAPFTCTHDSSIKVIDIATGNTVAVLNTGGSNT